MGFGLGDLGGWLLGYDEPDEVQYNPASIGGQWQDIFASNYLFPQLFEYLQASQATGQGGMLSAITKSGNAMPSDFNDIDWTKLTGALPSLKAQQAQKNAANFQATYDMFSKIPALEGIFQEASGNVDSTGALAKIFGDLSGSALGSAASSGFLSDPVKQGNVLGPLALQKYQIEQSIQKNAQAQALGMVGAGALPGSGLFGMNLGGPSPWTQGTLSAANLFGLGNSQGFLSASGQTAQNWNQYQMAGLDAQMQGFSTMFGAG